jgi:hypothetical protein
MPGIIANEKKLNATGSFAHAGPEALAKTTYTPGWPSKPIGLLHRSHGSLLVGGEVGGAA